MGSSIDLTQRRYEVSTTTTGVLGEETHHFRVDPSDRRLLTLHSTLHLSHQGATQSMVGSFTIDVHTLGLVRARYRFGGAEDEVRLTVEGDEVVRTVGGVRSVVVNPTSSTTVVPSYVAAQLPALLELRGVDRFTCARYAEGPMAIDGQAVFTRRVDDPSVWEQRVDGLLATSTHLHPRFGITMIDYGGARATRADDLTTAADDRRTNDPQTVPDS